MPDKIAVTTAVLMLAIGGGLFAVLSKDGPSELEQFERAVAEKKLDDLIITAPADVDTPEGMTWVPGGTFLMGDRRGKSPDEQFEHEVELDGYWMDKHEVTNAEFQVFVDATEYVTVAEKMPDLTNLDPNLVDSKDLKIPAEFNKPGAICRMCFDKDTKIDPNNTNAYTWWQYVPGANWKHPEGDGSDIKDRMDHPVVHVAHQDVRAYCEWAGKQLPTEAQWERAARGKLETKTYPWGDDRNPDGKWLNNIWQGSFPTENTATDGFEATSPVGSFPPNDFGLFDMSGNVWEWCADLYLPDYYHNSPRRNPPGPTESHDPQEPHILVKYVQRGGSFMCSDQYCVGYRNSARMKGEPDSGAFHCGFRCVVNVKDLDAFRNAPARKLAAKN